MSLLVLLAVALLACIGLHYAKEDSVTETACAALALACVMAVMLAILT